MKYLIPLLLLTGCVTTKEVPITTIREVSPVLVHPPLPAPVDLSSPQFYIITEDNCQAVFSQHNASAYFSVNSSGYKDLSTNIQELRRYILELQNLIIFYKDSLSSLENTNETDSNN